MKRQTVLLIIFYMLMATLVPTLAQGNPVDDPIQIQITGSLAYEDVNEDGLEDVLVDGVVILPTPGFDDLNFEAGQRVTVIGNLLPDNTIQATSLFLAADGVEATPETEPSPVVEQEPTPSSMDDGDAQDREEDEREREQREAEQEREQEQREREQDQNEAQRESRDIVEVNGEITDITQNYIVVDGVDVSSGGIFQPSQFSAGQNVRVTGIYENNGMLRALNITVIPTEEGQASESTSESATTPSCVSDTHPVVVTLVNEFTVEAAELIELHCAGNGFGDITRELLIAEQAGGDPQTYLDQYTESRDWGEVARMVGLEPDAVNPDRVLGHPR